MQYIIDKNVISRHWSSISLSYIGCNVDFSLSANCNWCQFENIKWELLCIILHPLFTFHYWDRKYCKLLLVSILNIKLKLLCITLHYFSLLGQKIFQIAIGVKFKTLHWNYFALHYIQCLLFTLYAMLTFYYRHKKYCNWFWSWDIVCK
jgi:hypothetical protein